MVEEISEPPTKRTAVVEVDQAIIKILESQELYGATFHKVSQFFCSCFLTCISQIIFIKGNVFIEVSKHILI